MRADHKKRQLRLYQGKKPPSEMVASIQQHKCTFALFILLKLTSNDVFFIKHLHWFVNNEYISNNTLVYEIKKFRKPLGIV